MQLHPISEASVDTAAADGSSVPFGSSLKGIPPTVPSSRPAPPLLGRESNPAPQKQKLNRASDPRLVGAAGDPGRSFPCPSTLTLNAWHDSGRQFPATARRGECYIAGVELVQKIIKGQFQVPEKFGIAPVEIWHNVLAA
jgi:hypothetical protein